jgi:hypothetical protein
VELRRLRAIAEKPSALTKEHADWLRALDKAADGLLTLAEHGLAATTVPDPVYKAVERILDENSAWIARPNDEVTKRVAFTAVVAAHTIIAAESGLAAGAGALSGCTIEGENGKRWRIVGPNGQWSMQPIGTVTAGEAEAICRAALSGSAAAGTTDEETARQVADRIINRFLDLGMMTVVPQLERALIRDRILAALATTRAQEQERGGKIARETADNPLLDHMAHEASQVGAFIDVAIRDRAAHYEKLGDAIHQESDDAS